MSLLGPVQGFASTPLSGIRDFLTAAKPGDTANIYYTGTRLDANHPLARHDLTFDFTAGKID